MSFTRKRNTGGRYVPPKKSRAKKNIPYQQQISIVDMISKIEPTLTENNYISISIVECKEPDGINYKVFKIDKNTYDGNMDNPTTPIIDLNQSNLQTAIDNFKNNNGFTTPHRDAKYAYFRLNLFYNENALTKFNIVGIPIYQSDTYNYCPIGESVFKDYYQKQNGIEITTSPDERIANEFIEELNEEEKTRLAVEEARLAQEAEKGRLAEEARIAAEKVAEEARLAQETEKTEDIVNLVPNFVEMTDYEKLNRMTQKPMVYMKF